MKVVDGGRILVAIPTFNRSAVIGEALDSVACQTHLPSQIVVVDDGSSDDTLPILERWKRAHGSINLTVLKTANQGAAAARNTALRLGLSQSDYVAFLDSDDLWHADFLQQTSDVLSACPEGVAATTDCLVLDMQEDAARVRDHSKLPQQPHLWFLRHGAGLASCTLFRSKSIAAAGYFPPELRTGHDTAFFGKVASLGQWVHVSAIAVTKRRNIVDVRQGSADSLRMQYDDFRMQWALASKKCYLHAPKEIRNSRKAKRLLSRRWRAAAMEALENDLPLTAKKSARAARFYDRYSFGNLGLSARIAVAKRVPGWFRRTEIRQNLALEWKTD